MLITGEKRTLRLLRRTFGFTDYFATFANDKSHRMMRAYGFAYYFYYTPYSVLFSIFSANPVRFHNILLSFMIHRFLYTTCCIFSDFFLFPWEFALFLIIFTRIFSILLLKILIFLFFKVFFREKFLIFQPVWFFCFFLPLTSGAIV